MWFKRIFISLLGIFCFTLPVISQTIFYQGMCHCGVTGDGFSTGLGSGSGYIHLHIPTGATIKKAFLFSYRIGYPPNAPITVNGIHYLLDTANCIMSVKNIISGNAGTPIKLYYKDITPDIALANTDSLQVIIPMQISSHINWNWFTAYLWVIYKKPGLSNVNYSILINDKNLTGYANYFVTPLNPIDTIYPVSFATYTDRYGDGNGHNMNSLAKINNVSIGRMRDLDSNNLGWIYSGTKGSFYYKNQALYGLEGDMPNSSINDGLADISSYLPQYTTSFNFSLEDTLYPFIGPTYSGIKLAYFLTYTSPCDTFHTSVSADTAICVGDSVQLQAGGGTSTGSVQAYQWQPAYGLSCTTCASPIASPDSSVTYTVRIYNNDSCSKVLPVRMLVHKIKFNYYTDSATCGDSNGAVFITTPNIAQYTLGSQSNANGIFTHLPGGSYNVLLTDSFGCQWQDTVQVGIQNNVSAAFGIFPAYTGQQPFHIGTYNNSTGANTYTWAVNGDTLHGSTIAYTFDSAGNYTVTLIACHNSYPCCDTLTQHVQVDSALKTASAFIPNVFTPNGDGVNDVFTVNLKNIQSGKISIFNRWGRAIEQTSMQQATNGNLTLNWNGKTNQGRTCPAGAYYFVVSYVTPSGDTKTVKGNVTLLR